MTQLSKYQPVIGLEIHVELKTKSKMFCQCSAVYFGKEPNSNVCPVCLGLPGALPVPNRKAIEWTILLGKALNCKINTHSKFDRKHYFYPDLPKGYQISQYDEPIAINGKLSIFNYQFSIKSQLPSSNIQTRDSKTFRIRRVHLEEDTGKLIHSGSETLIDFNRSGVPLVEIVTEPDFDNAEDVKRFLEELYVIIRYLGVSDADMEKGSMRLEPNISLREGGEKKLPNYKVEVKNINSFRFVKQAIEYEIERQKGLLEKGETPKQETRGWDEKKGITYSQRSKEEAHDYRYFPEPDIPPLTFSQEYIDTIQVQELPQQKLDRYMEVFGIKEQDAFVLTRDPETADFFEKVISNLDQKSKSGTANFEQKIANLIINRKISLNIPIDEFIDKAVEAIAPKETDERLLDITVNKIIETHKKVIDDYKSGKQNVLMFLVGQVMKEMKGKAEAKLVIVKLKEKLQ